MTSAQSKSQSDISFEDAMKELDKIVQKLEVGSVPLDASISLYERGAELRKICEAKLKDAQLRIEKIVSVENGLAKTETISHE